MEDKKAIEKENIEQVAGGRHYAKEPIIRDPAKREEIIKAAANHEPYTSKELPKELLTTVSGGETETYFARCPKCGDWEVLETYPGGWEIYCPKCGILYDASYIGDF